MSDFRVLEGAAVRRPDGGMGAGLVHAAAWHARSDSRVRNHAATEPRGHPRSAGIGRCEVRYQPSENAGRGCADRVR
jgi:hypothetical protein